ncbi:MAG: hypothetical protein CM15mP130_2740 [Verrucomicrobiota bacterium]|nr:MAG: hypothetical protein CM15mP130_2740 [Verrucomicrobiota bacterium]
MDTLKQPLQWLQGPKSSLKFRNPRMGGDTVYNDARSYFGKLEGRDRLGDHLLKQCSVFSTAGGVCIVGRIAVDR